MFKKVVKFILWALRLRTSKRHVYIFGRTLWYQEELNYEEDGRIRAILKDIFGSSITPEKFGEAIDVLYDRGMIPQLLDVVLKRYEPTFIHRLWNSAFMPHNPVYMTMKNSEIARVMSDFFLFNTRWIGDLSSLLPGLGLKSLMTATSSTLPASKN